MNSTQWHFYPAVIGPRTAHSHTYKQTPAKYKKTSSDLFLLAFPFPAPPFILCLSLPFILTPLSCTHFTTAFTSTHPHTRSIPLSFLHLTSPHLIPLFFLLTSSFSSYKYPIRSPPRSCLIMVLASSSTSSSRSSSPSLATTTTTPTPTTPTQPHTHTSNMVGSISNSSFPANVGIHALEYYFPSKVKKKDRDKQAASGKPQGILGKGRTRITISWLKA